MLSVVIPTQNMSTYLRPLLESFLSSSCDSFITEYIVVNDGSTDDTMAVLNAMSQESNWKGKLKVLDFSISQGRYQARKQGAMAAKEDLVFFSDTRVVLPGDAGPKLKELLKSHRYLMGMPFIDTSKSLFSLYWDRSHQWIYRKYFRDVKNGFYLNAENYEQYAKGTGMLIVEKRKFLDTCEGFGSEDLLSDDTLLLKEIVKTNPLFVSEKFAFEWEPRQSLKEFLWRLVDRGPGFVEYNFFYQRNRFFYAAIFAASFAVLVLVLSGFFLGSVLLGLLALFGVGAASVFLITQRPFEVLKLIPLHLLVLCSFSIGILYGLCYFGLGKHQKQS